MPRSAHDQHGSVGSVQHPLAYAPKNQPANHHKPRLPTMMRSAAILVGDLEDLRRRFPLPVHPRDADGTPLKRLCCALQDRPPRTLEPFRQGAEVHEHIGAGFSERRRGDVADVDENDICLPELRISSPPLSPFVILAAIIGCARPEPPSGAERTPLRRGGVGQGPDRKSCAHRIARGTADDYVGREKGRYLCSLPAPRAVEASNQASTLREVCTWQTIRLVRLPFASCVGARSLHLCLRSPFEESWQRPTNAES